MNLKNVNNIIQCAIFFMTSYSTTTILFFYAGCEGVNSGVPAIYSQFTTVMITISLAVVGIALLYHAP